MFKCFSWGCSSRIVPVNQEPVSSLQEIEEEVPECAICLEKLVFDRALESIIACSNPQVSHKFHRDCIKGCRDRFYTNQQVSCPLGCQGVFLEIKGLLVRSYWADMPWSEEDDLGDFRVFRDPLRAENQLNLDVFEIV